MTVRATSTGVTLAAATGITVTAVGFGVNAPFIMLGGLLVGAGAAVAAVTLALGDPPDVGEFAVAAHSVADLPEPRSQTPTDPTVDVPGLQSQIATDLAIEAAEQPRSQIATDPVAESLNAEKAADGPTEMPREVDGPVEANDMLQDLFVVEAPAVAPADKLAFDPTPVPAAAPVSAPAPAAVALAEPSAPELIARSSSRRVEEPIVHEEPEQAVDQSVAERPSATRIPRSVEPFGSSPNDVLDALVRAVSSDVAVLAAHLWLLDETTGTMRRVAETGPFKLGAEPLKVDGSSIGTSASTGRATLKRFTATMADGSTDTVWRYAVPLVSGSAHGAAAVDVLAARPDRMALTRNFVHLRTALSAALGISVAETETASAHVLLDAVAEIVRLVDRTALAEATLRHAINLSGADSGSVMLMDTESGRMRIEASYGLPGEIVASAEVSEGEGIAGWVLATAQPLLIEDLDDKGPNSRRHGVCSAMAVPIADEDGALGVLNVGCRTFHARFTATQLSALEGLGRMLAIGLRNASALTSSRELYLDTLMALSVALEGHDPYSQGSTKRVYGLTERLAEKIDLPQPERDALRIAAVLHDIGMANACSTGMLEDRPLTTLEWGLLKMHPVIAADVLEQAPALKQAVPIVYHHHERYDGSGYVLGLAGDDIPLGARILAVADAYVSMTSPRPYRSALTHEDAMIEIAAAAGSQFDPAVVEALWKAVS